MTLTRNFVLLVLGAVGLLRGWEAVQFPRAVYIAGQAVIGTALGSGFSAKTLSLIPQHVGIFTFAVVFILAACLGNGWPLS